MPENLKPSVWLSGLNCHDRLFLWKLTKLPEPFEIDAARLEAACRHCKYPHKRALTLIRDFAPAWQRMMEKRHALLTGQRDPESMPSKVRGALTANLLCRHPRMLRKMRRCGVLPC
jgi:hypothetical protein